MVHISLPPADDSITLIVPLGTRRSRRVVLTPAVARWLRDQLTAALGEPRRPVRLRLVHPISGGRP